MTALQPLAYGYLRDDILRDHDHAADEDRLRNAARSFGYELGAVFREPAPQNGTLPPAFVELVQECRRTAAQAVITLHGHLSNMPVCRMVLLAVLDVGADAAVHEVGP